MGEARTLRIAKNVTTLTLLMARGERPTMRGLIPVNGGEQRTAAPAETYLRPNPLSFLPSCCPKRFTTISGQALTWIPSARLFCLLSGRTKRDQKWGRSSGFLRREGEGAGTIPSGHSPQAGGGRVREGRGWVGEPRVWPGYGVALLRGSRGGYNSQRRRQPDSSLNCRGLAASSWCEGLECGRPRTGLPGPPRPSSAKVNSYCSTLSPRRSKYVTLSCLSTRGKLIWVTPAET